MNEEIKKQIFEKIKEYDTIVISRHLRPDGDAIGAAKGLKAIISASFPEKTVYVIASDTSEYLSFLGSDDEDVPYDVYTKAMFIVLDTATSDRIANDKYDMCPCIVKIDHHIEVEQFGDISWVEDKRSSASEMIVDFYLTFKDELTLTKEAATYLYVGMVTDSGRFRYSSTSGDTLRCASYLLDAGIDTEMMFCRLYLEDFDFFRFKAYVLRNMKMTPNGVVYLFVSKENQADFGLDREQAGSAISFLDSVKGGLIWIAFIEHEDGSIRARIRSRFVTVNKLAEKYRGGGHECAAAASVRGDAGMKQMLADADAMLKTYKAAHEGWL